MPYDAAAAAPIAAAPAAAANATGSTIATAADAIATVAAVPGFLTVSNSHSTHMPTSTRHKSSS